MGKKRYTSLSMEDGTGLAKYVILKLDANQYIIPGLREKRIK